jgi:protein SCO1/2
MRVVSAKKAFLVLNIFFLTLSMFVSVQAQQVEHYGSPLYSPRKYEPGKGETSNGLPTALKSVGIEQKLDGQMPLDAVFSDEEGRQVRLGDYFGKGRPVVLALVYYECPMLCTEVLNGLTGAVKGIPSLQVGKEFDVVSLSFDARENDKPGLAKNKKDAYVARYGREGSEAGWHFLTGTQGEIDKVTEAVGFSYVWDEASNQFAHAGAIMVITPEGRISRYLYGVEYAPKDLRFSIMESSENKIGTLAEQLYLYCFHYNPATGTYGFAVLTFIRAAAVVTMAGIVAMWFVFWRRNRKKVGATA